MKNKIELKRYLIITFIITICLFILFFVVNIIEYHRYTVNFNNKIEQVVSLLLEKYPMTTEVEIMELLNDDKESSLAIFDKYGIDLDKDSIIINNDKDFVLFMIINMIYLIFLVIILLLIFLKYNRKKDREIEDIINYIEQINKKNYELKIDTISEDELSILKNEIYKTTVMLKEAAENSNIDKMNLKKSLEDISHQIKTPLTSILIMLDNLIDDIDMDEKIRNDFIIDIKREVMNINFFVQNILKLSKFDVNMIHFIKEKVVIKKIIDESIKNVSSLCDLKNIKIDVNGESDILLYCDYRWEIEAVTNILKNCVEHSDNDLKIEINFSQNSTYCLLEIKDFGRGISDKDLPHIFERFYKGEKSSFDSIGIGLALAKKIIEEDNGIISVNSSDRGTLFTIKYFKV